MTVPLPSDVRRSLKVLMAARRDPSPAVDQRKFDRAWSDNGRLPRDSAEFMHGGLPHQVAIEARLRMDHEARTNGLNAATSEAANYLSTFVLFLAVAGLVAGSQISNVLQSPPGLLVWLSAAALLVLLRSHASRTKSWFDNYEGAGRRAGRITNHYLLVNSLREDLLRRNSYLQKAKRRLALVCLLYSFCIVAVCLGITVVVIVRLFG